jgi:biotin carboxylase
MGIEICRALTRRGWLVDILGEAGSPAFHSRFCARRICSPPCESGEPFLCVVDAARRQTPYDAIFVCNEEVLEALMSLPDFLRWPGLLVPERSSLQTALSKFAMMRVAHNAGVAIPRSIFASSETELTAAADGLGFPLIIKGDRGESGNHVRLVEHRATLRSAYREIAALECLSSKRPLVQEYITGEAYSVGGLFYRGRALRLCAHRKLVGVPPLRGLTVSGVTERPAGLLEEACKIFAALQYSGLGHVELIRDRNKCFCFLEINPRVWGTVGVAEYAGVDLFTPYLQLVRGIIPEPDLQFREGVRFHRIGREGRMIRLRPSRIAGFLRDCFNPRVRSDFSWTDPAPHIALLATRGLHRADPPH